MCVALNIHLHKEKFKCDDYSYTHWWIDPSNLFSMTSSWVVLFQVFLDVNCCALIYLFWTYIIPGYSKRTQGWALSWHSLYGDESEFRNFEIYELRQRLLQQSSFSIQTAVRCCCSIPSLHLLAGWGINTRTRLYHVSFRVISLCFCRNEITEDSCNIFDLSIEL